MTTELSFLVELLLNEKLQKSTKDLLAARIKEVCTPQPYQTRPAGVPQAASMQAIIARNPDILPAPPMPEIPSPPVAVVAHTPQAAAAMNSRNIAIAESLAGKIDKTTGRPRKF